MSSTVSKLPILDAMNITLDARVVALRWDVIPWGLVLDLDVPISEDNKAFMKRAWLCFSGIDSITWNFAAARLPTGIWLISPIVMSDLKNGFHEYRFSAILPQFQTNGSMMANPSHEIIIRAQCIECIISKESVRPGEYGLTWRDRVALANDQAFIDVVGEQGQNEGTGR